MGREPLILAAIAFFVMLGFGVVIPVLPVFVRSFNVGYLEVGAVVSAFAVVRLVASPFCGMLIRRGGERTVLAIGIGIVAVSSALVGVAQSYLLVLLLRGAGGVGSAMFSVSAMTLLLANTPAGQRGRAVGLYQGGFLVGGMAGPALGGMLALISLRAPFFFYALTLVVAGVIGLVFLGRAGGAKPQNTQPTRPLRKVISDVRYQAACLANFVQGWAGIGVRSTLVPVLVVEALHHDAAVTGIVFAVAAVAQTIMLGPAGSLVDRYGSRPAMIFAYLVGAVALVLVSISPNIWVLVLLLCVYAAAAAFTGTAPAAAVGDAARGRSGPAVAVFSMFSDLGAIVGPLAAGALLDATSFAVAFGSGAILMVVTAAFALKMPRAFGVAAAGADGEPQPAARNGQSGN